MALSNTNATQELVEAMRTRLAADDPAMAGNVDQPDVQKNFAALGQAIFRILTVRAEVASDATVDVNFWGWVADVNGWLKKLAAWQTGLDSAFQAYAPTTPAEQSLKAALIAVPKPGALPASISGTPQGKTPVALKGKIQ